MADCQVDPTFANTATVQLPLLFLFKRKTMIKKKKKKPLRWHSVVRDDIQREAWGGSDQKLCISLQVKTLSLKEHVSVLCLALSLFACVHYPTEESFTETSPITHIDQHAWPNTHISSISPRLQLTTRNRAVLAMLTAGIKLRTEATLARLPQPQTLTINSKK